MYRVDSVLLSIGEYLLTNDGIVQLEVFFANNHYFSILTFVTSFFKLLMNFSQLFVAYMTIVRKEVSRFFRVWKQTLVPPIITTTLYYIIFGQFI